jgi:hypothetical protein
VVQSIEAFLAGRRAGSESWFLIDYSLNAGSIPFIAFGELRDQKAAAAALSGKSLLIDFETTPSTTRIVIPGQDNAVEAVVTVIAAETLKGGRPMNLGAWPCFILAWLLVYGLKRIGSLALRIPTAILAFAGMFFFPVVVEASQFDIKNADGMLILLVGTVWTASNEGMRQYRLRRERNAVTGLLTSNALQFKDRIGSTLIVAHVHNYLEIASKLSHASEKSFARTITERLLPESQDTLYQGDNGLFFWEISETDAATIGKHLGSLAQIARNGVPLEGRSVSLVVTFGVDQRVNEPTSSRMAGAISASSTALEESM